MVGRGEIKRRHCFPVSTKDGNGLLRQGTKELLDHVKNRQGARETQSDSWAQPLGNVCYSGLLNDVLRRANDMA